MKEYLNDTRLGWLDAGFDFNQTFAPVVKLQALQIILAIVAAHDLEMLQVEEKMTFLNFQLEEEIFMRQPEGYLISGRENLFLSSS